MYTKVFEYEDFLGNKRKETHYFHLMKSEVVDYRYSAEGGIERKVAQIMEAKKEGEIIEVVKDLIHKSYGVISPDGKQMIKNDQVWDEFRQSEAYSQLYMELCQDEKKMAEFITKILPKDMQDVAAKASQEALSNMHNGNMEPVGEIVDFSMPAQ